MTKRNVKIYGLFFIFFFIQSVIWTPQVWSQERSLYIPDEILVKYRADVLPQQIRAIKTELGLGVLRHLKRIGVEHLGITSRRSMEEILTRLRASGVVEYAEPNYLRYPDIISNAPLFSSLWGLNNTGQTGGIPDSDIDAPEAWNIVTGDPNFVVAVIDSGMDMSHPDLAANVWTNSGEIEGNGIDDDGNGYIDDIHGWDFSEHDNDASDTVSVCGGHGTHVSGTIGAVGNNGFGVTGVNWNVKIMPLKVFKPYLNYCAASDSDIIAAINYGADKGVKVSNNSYGGGSYNQALYEAIQASKGLYVAAAGNGGADGLGDNINITPEYPASYNLPNIIAVAATDNSDRLASFSNYGTVSVDMAAPGISILSTTPDNSYSSYSGTSMATPHVAGSAAILWDQDPLATVNEIKWRLLKGVDPKGYPVLTGGRLNLNNSLNLPSPMVTVDTNPVGSTTVPRGGTFGYNIVIRNQIGVSQVVNISIVVRLPDGVEVILNRPSTITMTGNQVISRTFSINVSNNAPAGTYTFFSRAKVSSQSYDEDPVEYTIF